MGKENFEAYSAGRFESMSRTRDAFLGHRDEVNTRSQVLGTPKDAFKQVETYTSQQAKTQEQMIAKQQQLSNHGVHFDTSIIKELHADRLMQLEPQIWAAIDKQLGKESKQQLLTAIEAKKAQTQQAEQITNAEQVAITQQLQVEAGKLAQQAPAEIIIGGLALLAIWVARKLPDRMYRVLNTATILSLILTACATVGASAYTPEIPNQNNPTAMEANLPDSENKPATTITNNQEVTPQPEATAVTIDQLNELNTAINSEIAQAVEDADPATKQSYEDMDQSQSVGMIFANSLTSPENPKDRILDKNSFHVFLLDNGRPGLELEVDSVWGKAHEVFVIDTGEKLPMFVTLEGGLSALGISDDKMAESKKDYELIFEDFSSDPDIKTNSLYAAVRQKSTGKIVAVVDAKKQWTSDIKSAKAVETKNSGEVVTVQQMAIDYVAGKKEIDFNKLSDKEYEEISVAITEQLNNRIESPIYTPENGQITYFDNKTGEPSTMSTSEFDQKKAELAPNPYIPAKKDADGTWMYLDEETKQYVRIEGSAGFDFSSVVDENNMDSGIIKWPTTKKGKDYPKYDGSYPDLTYPERLLKESYYGGLYVPTILTSKQYVKVPVYGANGVRTYSKAFTFLVKRTYGFEKIYVPFIGSSMDIYEENSSKEEAITFNLENDGVTKKIKRLLTENQIYFLGFPTEQADRLNRSNRISLDHVEGIVSVENSLATVANDQSKENKLLFILAWMLIEHQ